MADTFTAARTVVALFERKENADRAADELLAAGFTRESIGVISGHQLSEPQDHVSAKEDSSGKMVSAVQKGLAMGGGLGAVAGGLSALLIPGVGPLMVGGALASAFLGAGLGAAVGGVMAGLMKAGVNESDARLFEEGLRHGGVVVTVHTDDRMDRQAVVILDRNGAMDMDEHSRENRNGTNHVDGATGSRSNDTTTSNSRTGDKPDYGGADESAAQAENARRLAPYAKEAAIQGGGAKPEDFER
ncbi:MAG: hypothetical protein SGI92_33850 [Bryobacteraceae bacterium]|nr:hypothetical protein [Bryobacteraceae bacterium]